MNLSNFSISVLVITCLWLAVIITIVVSKYRNRTDIHPLDTERRNDERRENVDERSNTVASEGGREESTPLSDNRREGDRRETNDWETEFRAVRSRIENETGTKDV